MAIDRVEFMTLDTLPPAPTGEVQVQFNMLKQLALHPDMFRLVFLPLPADLRLHAKYALINAWTSGSAKRDVCSINIADFTSELLEAVHNGRMLSDLKHYAEPEVLLVDDLQFITGKEATQEAFFGNVLKPRIEAKKLTILFSEYGYEQLCVALRDDLRNLLRLGFHNTEDQVM